MYLISLVFIYRATGAVLLSPAHQPDLIPRKVPRQGNQAQRRLHQHLCLSHLGLEPRPTRIHIKARGPLCTQVCV